MMTPSISSVPKEADSGTWMIMNILITVWLMDHIFLGMPMKESIRLQERVWRLVVFFAQVSMKSQRRFLLWCLQPNWLDIQILEQKQLWTLRVGRAVSKRDGYIRRRRLSWCLGCGTLGH